MVIESKLNYEAIKGLAISTAFFRSDWTNDTTRQEFENDDGDYGLIIEQALDFLKWVGITNVELDATDVKDTLWAGWEDDEDQDIDPEE